MLDFFPDLFEIREEVRPRSSWVSNRASQLAEHAWAIVETFLGGPVCEVGLPTNPDPKRPRPGGGHLADVPSHFNNETPFDSVVAYSLAAVGAVLVVILGTMAVTAFQSHIDAPASMRLALRAGYALLVAGLLAGVAMIVRGTTLVRTGHRTAGYDEAGFLKAFHGVTLHAVLVLPLLAWWLAHRGIADPRRRTLIVAGAVAVNLTAAVVVLMRSLLTL